MFSYYNNKRNFAVKSYTTEEVFLDSVVFFDRKLNIHYESPVLATFFEPAYKE